MLMEKKQKKDKKKGAPASAGSRKGRCAASQERVPERKLRRVYKLQGLTGAEVHIDQVGESIRRRQGPETANLQVIMLEGILKRLEGSDLPKRRRVAQERRRNARDVRRTVRCALREQRALAEAKKAKRSTAAKKGAATRKARKVTAQAAVEASV
ncbi:MAG: hypothetical protein A3F48_03730 [Candidatus Yanofskybacteria bacterium RIFCSPHIGHO2_12_FULL_41_9]|nr:MAG: hypothetical protein A3F48_03730 [Candidatus Yanofskybacteria bacterium RIFCSPHIGHO2_12_FULL_41_9]